MHFGQILQKLLPLDFAYEVSNFLLQIQNGALFLFALNRHLFLIIALLANNDNVVDYFYYYFPSKNLPHRTPTLIL